MAVLDAPISLLLAFVALGGLAAAVARSRAVRDRRHLASLALCERSPCPRGAQQAHAHWPPVHGKPSPSSLLPPPVSSVPCSAACRCGVFRRTALTLSFSPCACAQLEYTAPSSLGINATGMWASWRAPAGCSVAAIPGGQFTAAALCREVGVQAFRIELRRANASVALRDKVNVPVYADSPMCYDWYVAPADIGNIVIRTSTSVVVRVWIYEPSAATAQEREHSAQYPSTSSQLITRSFRNLGEHPVMQFGVGIHGRVASKHFVGMGYWELVVSLPLRPHTTVAALRGNYVGLLGCQVGLAKVVFASTPLWRFQGMRDNQDSAAPSVAKHAVKQLACSACAQNVQILLCRRTGGNQLSGQFDVYITRDDFETSSRIYSISGHAQESDAVVVSNDVFLFATGGKIFRWKNNTLANVSPVFGSRTLPSGIGETRTHVRTEASCGSLAGIEHGAGVVFAWSEVFGGNKTCLSMDVLISNDEGSSFRAIGEHHRASAWLRQSADRLPAPARFNDIRSSCCRIVRRERHVRDATRGCCCSHWLAVRRRSRAVACLAIFDANSGHR